MVADRGYVAAAANRNPASRSAVAVGFGLLNLAYVVAAGLALIPKRSRIHYVGLLVGFVLLRSAFLGTLENPEPRYTLECYPAIVVLASSMLAGGRSFRTKSQ